MKLKVTLRSDDQCPHPSPRPRSAHDEYHAHRVGARRPPTTRTQSASGGARDILNLGMPRGPHPHTAAPPPPPTIHQSHPPPTTSRPPDPPPTHPSLPPPPHPVLPSAPPALNPSTPDENCPPPTWRPRATHPA